MTHTHTPVIDPACPHGFTGTPESSPITGAILGWHIGDESHTDTYGGSFCPNPHL